MNLISKKSVIGLTLGAFVLAGVASPLAIQAADSQVYSQPAAGQHAKVDPDKIAQRISETFGVNKADVVKYQQQGTKTRDLFKASFLAKASGKSLSEVISLKTSSNTWKDVANTLGVTKEQIKATRQDIASTRLETKLNIPKQVSLDLLQQGYHSRDIAVANALANNTGKQISDILSLKKINNTWHDVAQSLGVDDNTFKKDIKDVRAAFPHHPFHGGHGPVDGRPQQ